MIFLYLCMIVYSGFVLPLRKIKGINTLRACLPLVFYLAVNKLVTDKTQNFFSLIAEHFGFIKYTLN